MYGIRIVMNNHEVVVDESDKLNIKSRLKWIRWGIVAVIALLAVLCVYYHEQLTLHFIIEQISSHPSISALVLLGMYTIKAISFFIPIVLLYTSSGLILTPVEAISVNILGLLIACTVPYYIGRFLGTSLVDNICLRYPKLMNFMHLKNKEFLFSFAVISIVPMELSALLFGALGIAYRPCIFGSMFCLIPKMLVYTFLGYMIYDRAYPGCIILLSTGILIMLGTLLFCRFYPKNQNKN
ncbi:MAG TPA: hypothetical protein DCK76_09570 [Desulfotomaculum sp.]|nr:hypothetical protein [Desulfotomaculum sp.]